MSHRLCKANFIVASNCNFLTEEGSNYCSLHSQSMAVCSICHDDILLKSDDDILFNINIGHKLPCDHIFHYKCIKKWIEKKETCPYCRTEIDTSDPLISEKQKIELQGARYLDRLLTTPRNNVAEIS